MLSCLLVAGCNAQPAVAPEHAGSTPSSLNAAPSTVFARPDFPTDLSDKKKLAGYATNIFAGTVRAVEPSAEKYGTPWTSASVEVVISIKGHNTGTIQVLQQGGTRQTGTVVLVGDDTLLTAGSSYILSTLSNGPGEQTLIPVWGNRPISNSDVEAIKNSGDTQSGVIAQFRDAVLNQIPFHR